MTDIIRRALMGDAKAAEECTKAGVVIPCPHCGGEAQIGTFFWERKANRLPTFYVRCKECKTKTNHEFTTVNAAISRWNQRFARHGKWIEDIGSQYCGYTGYKCSECDEGADELTESSAPIVVQSWMM